MKFQFVVKSDKAGLAQYKGMKAAVKPNTVRLVDGEYRYFLHLENGLLVQASPEDIYTPYTEETLVDVYDTCDSDEAGEDVVERMTVADVREKLHSIWMDDEGYDDDDTEEDVLTATEINEADFDELDRMLEGSGYYMTLVD